MQHQYRRVSGVYCILVCIPVYMSICIMYPCPYMCHVVNTYDIHVHVHLCKCICYMYEMYIWHVSYMCVCIYIYIYIYVTLRPCAGLSIDLYAVYT